MTNNQPVGTITLIDNAPHVWDGSDWQELQTMGASPTITAMQVASSVARVEPVALPATLVNSAEWADWRDRIAAEYAGYLQHALAGDADLADAHATRYNNIIDEWRTYDALVSPPNTSYRLDWPTLASALAGYTQQQFQQEYLCDFQIQQANIQKR